MDVLLSRRYLNNHNWVEYWDNVQQTWQLGFRCFVWKSWAAVEWHQVCLHGPNKSHTVLSVMDQKYPLVNVYITMENHHFQWLNPL